MSKMLSNEKGGMVKYLSEKTQITTKLGQEMQLKCNSENFF